MKFLLVIALFAVLVTASAAFAETGGTARPGSTDTVEPVKAPVEASTALFTRIRSAHVRAKQRGAV